MSDVARLRTEILETYPGQVVTPLDPHWDAWLDAVRREEAWAEAARALPLFARHSAGLYLSALGRAVVPALVDVVREGMSRPVEVGACRDACTEVEAVAWLAEHAPDRAVAAFVSALSDRRKTVVKHALAGLENGRAVSALVDALGSSRGQVRRGAAEALGRLGDAAAIPGLEDALAREPGGAEDALLAALAACREGSLPWEADDSVLDAALAAVGAEPVPNLPVVHWRSGKPMSPGARDWLVQAVLAENHRNHDPALLGLRDRLEPDDLARLSPRMRILAEAGNPYPLAIVAGPIEVNAMGAQLEAAAGSQMTAFGQHTLEVLVRHGSPLALAWLFYWIDHSERPSLSMRIIHLLRPLARAGGVPLEVLRRGLPEVAPPGDFDHVHPILRDAMTAVDRAFWPGRARHPPVPQLPSREQACVAAWCAEQVGPWVGRAEREVYEALLAATWGMLNDEPASMPPLESLKSRKGPLSVAVRAAMACQTRPDMRYASVRSAAGRAARICAEVGEGTAFLERLEDEILRLEAQVAVDRYAPEPRRLDRVYLRVDRGNGVAGHFIGRLDSGAFALVTKMKGRWRYFEGDRDAVLATLPDALFAEGVAALERVD